MSKAVQFLLLSLAVLAGCRKPISVAQTAQDAADVSDVAEVDAGMADMVDGVPSQDVSAPDLDVSTPALDVNGTPPDVSTTSSDVSDAMDVTSVALDAAIDAPDLGTDANTVDSGLDVPDTLPEKLRFVVVADPQMGMTPTSDGSDLDMQYFNLAITKIGALSPPASFVLDCGDLVHGTTAKLWTDYLTTAGKMPIPHHEVMGNHDGWSQAGLDYWRNTLGKLDMYAFTDGDALFIALNSYFLKNPTALPKETQAQKEFLTSTLAQHPGAKYKFLFMHMPIFTQNATETEDYWNLPQSERNWLLGIVDSANITGVFTGHFHRTDVVNYKGMLLLTSGPISVPMGSNSDGTPAERGFFVIDLDRITGTLTHTWHPLPASEL